MGRFPELQHDHVRPFRVVGEPSTNLTKEPKTSHEMLYHRSSARGSEQFAEVAQDPGQGLRVVEESGLRVTMKSLCLPLLNRPRTD